MFPCLIILLHKGLFFKRQFLNHLFKSVSSWCVSACEQLLPVLPTTRKRFAVYYVHFIHIKLPVVKYNITFVIEIYQDSLSVCDAFVQ
jgi:hypothetical protein